VHYHDTFSKNIPILYLQVSMIPVENQEGGMQILHYHDGESNEPQLGLLQ
jgi:hypothetical protein